MKWRKLWHCELLCSINHLIDTKRERKGRDWNMKNLDSDKKSPVFGEKEEEGSSVVAQRVRLSKLLSQKATFCSSKKEWKGLI